MPEADERIRVPKLWAVEFYSPRHIGKLMENLRRMGWHGRGGMFEPPDMSTWLADARRKGLGWRKCSAVGGERAEGARSKFIRWPRGVANADGYLSVVSEGLVAFGVCFGYDDDSAAAIEDALRRPRWTRSKLTTRGWEHHDPLGQRYDDILMIRNERVERTARWFRENAPGVYTSGGFEGQPPTCELLTFKKATPFPRAEERPADVEHLQTPNEYLVALEAA